MIIEIIENFLEWGYFNPFVAFPSSILALIFVTMFIYTLLVLSGEYKKDDRDKKLINKLIIKLIIFAVMFLITGGLTFICEFSVAQVVEYASIV